MKYELEMNCSVLKTRNIPKESSFACSSRQRRVFSGKIKNQRGQVVIMLLLVMVVTLGIGLSIIGRSTTEISTSTKTENSSRAFSAAEAGLEQAFTRPVPTPGVPVGFSIDGLDNQSSADVSVKRIPEAGLALEYLEPINKDSFAQFWFVNPQDVIIPYYTSGSFDVYFGDPAPQGDSGYYISSQEAREEQPAIKVHVIYWNGTQYLDKSFMIESNISRLPINSFLDCSSNPTDGNCDANPTAISTNTAGTSRSFYRKYRVNMSLPVGSHLVMARIRVLYSNLEHPVAISPISGSLPPQARLYNSTGVAGSIQRELQVFQPDLVMPWLFDYALFSAGDLEK